MVELLGKTYKLERLPGGSAVSGTLISVVMKSHSTLSCPETFNLLNYLAQSITTSVLCPR